MSAAITKVAIEAAAKSGSKLLVQTTDGECFGHAEYVNGSWVGIRQPQENNRLDEYPADRVEAYGLVKR